MPRSLNLPDRQAAVAFLTKYDNQMTDLMEILSRGHSMTVSDRANAREMYRALKDALKGDHRRLSRKESQGQATHIETAFLLPTVHEASTELMPATNSNPLRSDWLGAVYAAEIDISHCLGQLKRLRTGRGSDKGAE